LGRPTLPVRGGDFSQFKTADELWQHIRYVPVEEPPQPLLRELASACGEILLGTGRNHDLAEPEGAHTSASMRASVHVSQ